MEEKQAGTWLVNQALVLILLALAPACTSHRQARPAPPAASTVPADLAGSYVEMCLGNPTVIQLHADGTYERRYPHRGLGWPGRFRLEKSQLRLIPREPAEPEETFEIRDFEGRKYILRPAHARVFVTSPAWAVSFGYVRLLPGDDRFDLCPDRPD
jgi:hypothetical protein